MTKALAHAGVPNGYNPPRLHAEINVRRVIRCTYLSVIRHTSVRPALLISRSNGLGVERELFTSRRRAEYHPSLHYALELRGNLSMEAQASNNRRLDRHLRTVEDILRHEVLLVAWRLWTVGRKNDCMRSRRGKGESCARMSLPRTKQISGCLAHCRK